MTVYNLAVIPSDGVGPEVVAAGTKVLNALSNGQEGLNFRYSEFPWGSDFYREPGLLMPERRVGPTPVFRRDFVRGGG